MEPELVRYVAATTGLSQEVAGRVVADVVAFFSETASEYVCRRHAELQAVDKRNDEIWALLSDELGRRPVSAGPISPRQMRRMVYG